MNGMMVFSRIVMSAEVFLNLGGTTDMLFALSFGLGRFFLSVL